MRDYFIVKCQVLRFYYSENDKKRWAFGNVGRSYILGVYTTESEARTVRRLLQAMYPAKHRYVKVKVCKGNSHAVREKLSAEVGGKYHYKYLLNRFYPEGMCNGYSDALPPVSTEILKDWIREPGRRLGIILLF